MDDQRQGGPGLPERRGERHAAEVGLEAGGRQGGRDAFERLLVGVSGKGSGDARRIRSQPGLTGEKTNQTDFL